jgi:hypothetical protein
MEDNRLESNKMLIGAEKRSIKQVLSIVFLTAVVLLAFLMAMMAAHQVFVHLKKHAISDTYHLAERLAKDSRLAIIQLASENVIPSVQIALDSWDHLVQDYDPGKPNYGVVSDHPELIDLNYTNQGNADWQHINAIDYNPQLDQILLTAHNFSEIWIIDRSTTTAEAAGHTGGNSGRGGDLLYRWGNPRTYGAGTRDEKQLFVPHDAEWIEAGYPGEGNLLIFSNGGGRPDGSYSSIEEITPPLEEDGNYTYVTGTAFGPVEVAWRYTAETPTDFYAMNISGQQRLANGNTLICDGLGAYFFEITAGGETVWDYQSSGAVFRVERYTADYPGFDGSRLDDETSNLSPEVDAGGPYSVDPGTMITLIGSASWDSDGWITSYAWDLDNDGVYDDASGLSAGFSATASGTFTISLQVTDNSGEVDTATTTVTISDSVVESLDYPVVDTGQRQFFGNSSQITTPSTGDMFYGQDAQFDGEQPIPDELQWYRPHE